MLLASCAGSAEPVSPPPALAAPAPIRAARAAHAEAEIARATAISTHTPSAIEEALARWLARAGSATVHVDGASHGRASGALVSGEGHVLTAAHVVVDLAWASVTWPDGHTTSARVIERDDGRDLALLETREPTSACVPVASVEAGAWVLLSGFAGSLEGATPSRSIGVVLGEAPADDDASAIEAGALPLRAGLSTSAAVAPGMSGGPALDAGGALVGIVTATGGRIAPVAGWDALAPLRCPASFERVPLEPGDPSHLEDARDATLRDRLTIASPTRTDPDAMPHPSMVQLHIPMGATLDGLVVGRGLVLTLAEDMGTLEEPNSSVALPSHPSAHVVGPIAIDGELAIVRVEGLVAPPFHPRRRAPEVGSIVRSLVLDRTGVVTASALTPGVVTPFLPPPGEHFCGTMLGMRRAQSPTVTLDHPVLAHDASALRGELLVDAEGEPVAMHVGHHIEGLGYAVPLLDALARFDDVLTHP
ncbi:MAG: serine protease [Sandaracinaceae bacterium]|nr:serine protease [Sandaracinaceae bacterium]